MSQVPVFDFENDPHRRFNPLLSEWVLVSPHRAKRPWEGQVERPPSEGRPRSDPQCYLCPGNTRASGLTNPHYESTFVFTNDFAALHPHGPFGPAIQDGILRYQPVTGECRVICFSPRHDLTLAEMSADEIRHVVDLWQSQVAELEQRFAWVQVFENKGTAMGCSNPHPHGQIWASDVVPSLISREESNQSYYFEAFNRPLLLDVVNEELKRGERIVEQVGNWVAWVPFWACWPFEIIIAPHVSCPDMASLDFAARLDLSELLRRVLIRYDNLFETSFPYSFGWHFAPPHSQFREAWLLHAHLYPPLLRSASVRKFMVGYEMLAESQRDLTPEQAAQRLRDLPMVHYKVGPDQSPISP